VSNMCSVHQGYDADCVLCNTHPRDVFPDWDRKLAEAKRSGVHKCTRCGFEYYRTADDCPLCDEPMVRT
jgi:rubrerythrin